MRSLVIRPAAESDLDAVMRLVQACIDDMRRQGIDQWDEIYPSRVTCASDVAAGTLLTAWVGAGLLAGIFTLDEQQSPEWAAVPWTIRGVPTAVVHRLMVEPRHQGQGIARRLMQFAESQASSGGFEAIRLDAFSLNPRALQLYRTLGYTDVGSGVFRKGVFRCFEKRLAGAPQDHLPPQDG